MFKERSWWVSKNITAKPGLSPRFIPTPPSAGVDEGAAMNPFDEKLTVERTAALIAQYRTVLAAVRATGHVAGILRAPPHRPAAAARRGRPHPAPGAGGGDAGRGAGADSPGRVGDGSPGAGVPAGRRAGAGRGWALVGLCGPGQLQMVHCREQSIAFYGGILCEEGC